MRLRTIAFFGAGYVLGTRAGRDRYEQLVASAHRFVQRVQEGNESPEDSPVIGDDIVSNGATSQLERTQPLNR